MDDLPNDVLDMLLTYAHPRDACRVCTLNHALLGRLSRTRLRAMVRRLRWQRTASPDVVAPTRGVHDAAQVLTGACEWTVRVVASPEKSGWIYAGVCDVDGQYAWAVRMADGFLLTFEVQRKVCFQRHMPHGTKGGIFPFREGFGNNVVGKALRFRFEAGRVWCDARDDVWRLVVALSPDVHVRPFVYLPRQGDHVDIDGFT